MAAQLPRVALTSAKCRGLLEDRIRDQIQNGPAEWQELEAACLAAAKADGWEFWKNPRLSQGGLGNDTKMSHPTYTGGITVTNYTKGAWAVIDYVCGPSDRPPSQGATGSRGAAPASRSAAAADAAALNATKCRGQLEEKVRKEIESGPAEWQELKTACLAAAKADGWEFCKRPNDGTTYITHAVYTGGRELRNYVKAAKAVINHRQRQGLGQQEQPATPLPLTPPAPARQQQPQQQEQQQEQHGFITEMRTLLRAELMGFVTAVQADVQQGKDAALEAGAAAAKAGAAAAKADAAAYDVANAADEAAGSAREANAAADNAAGAADEAAAAAATAAASKNACAASEAAAAEAAAKARDDAAASAADRAAIKAAQRAVEAKLAALEELVQAAKGQLDAAAAERAKSAAQVEQLKGTAEDRKNVTEAARAVIADKAANDSRGRALEATHAAVVAEMSGFRAQLQQQAQTQQQQTQLIAGLVAEVQGLRAALAAQGARALMGDVDPEALRHLAEAAAAAGATQAAAAAAGAGGF
ncbi:hypothetical protein Rsub_05405 [Raphidocelis subcapitata]|uniref:Uncharacterized protein n=1 Tax=Raphidocelis subcapitata TaxID=307507 RepID=A0A2V0NYU5_9CHLO|nr:hypothetical protein Rsub_05405 [Raphidocelis subcapitata]|eukprot:GBF92786.1 hypothetical protein Rsub_05405 [Raphidocelis subcapitata]